jgi:AcrR family transcriptional regulator
MASKNTKARIRKNAIDLFKEKGYDAVTIIDICEKSNLTKGSFYYHYSSKDDLLSDFYADMDFLTANNFMEMLNVKSSWELIKSAYDIYMDRILEPGIEILSRFFVLKIQKNKDFFQFNVDLDKIFIPLIEKAQSNGEISNMSNASNLFKTSNYLIKAIILEWCINKGDFDIRKEVKNALETHFVNKNSD